MINIDANTYNTLKVFGDFANRFGSDSKAVARLGDSGHVVNTTPDDKAYAFKRDADQKRLNDDTRTAFRNAIASLFGGAENIPKNVAKAMRLGDYGKGKPLTARRIAEVAGAVTDAIRKQGGLMVDGQEVISPTFMDDFGAVAVKGGTKSAGGIGLLPGGAADIIENGLKADSVKGNGVAVMTKATESKTAAAEIPKDMRPVTIDAAKAQKMTQASNKLLRTELEGEDLQTCAKLLEKYGNGLPAKTARVLSNYIVNNVKHNMDTNETCETYAFEPLEDRVKMLAEEMKSWSEFKFGDPRLKEVGQKFAQRQNDYVKDTIGKQDMFDEKQPDVFKQLYGDANRGKWKINGKKFAVGNEAQQQISEKFLATVTDPTERKALSILFNQGSLMDLQCIQLKDQNLAIPGGNLFVSHDFATEQHEVAHDFDLNFNLQVSKDGKTAVITIEVDRDLVAGMGTDDWHIGTLKIAQRATVDLTRTPLPVITDITFAQTFSPDKIR